jgi:hypothetical protein
MLAMAVDPTQRRILLVAASAAVVFVLALLSMAHPPEAGIRWTLAGVGLREGKGHMFLVVRDYLQLEVPRLAAAGIVSFTWIVFIALLVSAVMSIRRVALKT